MKRSLLNIYNKAALLLLFSILSCATALAQDKRLTGTVFDEQNQPLPGATIKNKSGQIAVGTDVNGKFTISVANNEQTLIVHFVGYVDEEVNIGSQTNFTVRLTPSSKNLNEVIVVGYGTVRKKDLTGAVASVSGKTLAEVPAPNLIDQLKGRTAGVDVVSNGATPGTGGQIRIRGNRTITTGNNDGQDGPLVVLDGIPYPGSINDFAPEDIASIDILKDASATAVYGSRGAGGVILVTTKRGRAGKTVVSYDAYYANAKVLGKYNIYDGAGYAKLKADAATYNAAAPGTSAYPITPAEQAALTAGVSTDWQDLIYRTAPTQSHQLTVSGGGDATQFNIGAGFYRQDGIIVNQYFDRADLRTTIDHRISSRVKIGLNSINTLRYTSLPGGGGVPGGLVRTTPLASLKNEDGTVNLFPQIGSIDAAAVSPYTLITKASSIYDRTRRYSTFNSFYGEVNILDGLKYRLNVGLNFIQENGNTYNGTLTYVNGNSSLNNASLYNNEQWNYNVQNLLYYNKTFNKHRIDFTALYEITKDHNKNSNFATTGVPTDYILNSNFNLASGAITSGGSFSEQGLLSYMARFAYSYDDRYMVTLTARRDGASSLAPGHQWFTYPSIGLGWNISNEAFMKNVTLVNNLKLRGGFGVSGNRNVGAYATLGGLTSTAYNFGSGGQLAYTVTSLPNPNLGWQSTAQTDIGLDITILNNRITANIDVYQQKTKDILLQVSLPPSSGTGSTFQNLGKTESRGIEINLSTINIQTKGGFTWSTDFSFAVNREKITQLTNASQLSDPGNGWFVGQPLNVIYDVKKIGIWQTEDKTNGTLAKQTSPVQFPGQIRAQDVNGDGIINANDRQILGNFQPKWVGGFTTRFAYKAFDLSAIFYARMGMKVLLPYFTADGGAAGFAFFNQGRVNQLKTNYWTPTNPTNEFPAPDASTDRLLFGSTLGYYDGSFIKCRSINLGYVLPTKLINKIGLSSLRVYANATNPFIVYSPIVRDHLALDPEGNGYGGSVNNTGGNAAVTNRAVSVNLNNPSYRQFTVGVNAKF
ncbi:TonB-dependent receptor [Mucilaginibacter sp.]|uniref:SusC/RagA family TonB-linked outer membrane protein n=1 Tax=Mucilaginibacter sp. TaxID=1882438 RepID=UPI0032653EBA